MILIIDNYDSFVHNLARYFALTGAAYKIVRNDEITLEQVRALNPDRIIISPGPGSPEDKKYFGVCADIIAEMGKTIPTLGVCLGMQGIVHVFGGKIVKAPLSMHGKISPIAHNGQGMFNNIPEQLEVMRYHSLIADPATLPQCLEITAVCGEPEDLQQAIDSDNFEIMAPKHRQ